MGSFYTSIDQSADPQAPPAGGDARRLAAAFGVSGRTADIERVLRAPSWTLEQGELPDGLDMCALRGVRGARATLR